MISLGLILAFTISFPGDVPTRPTNYIADMLNVQTITPELRTTVFTFEVGRTPSFQGRVIVDGSRLTFF